MENVRTYGKPPFRVAVVHGGPGAAGEMAPVARELASGRGVLEPLQTASSLEAQVEELRAVLEKHADLPVALVGFSWGAWLSFILAARYPAMVRKLVLVGSGPFEEEYAAGIHRTRLSRLSPEERGEVELLQEAMDGPVFEKRNAAFARLGAVLSKADAYDPITDEPCSVDHDVDIFKRVWSEAAGLRKGGKLLELSKYIECPVVAIHGDCDPHPAGGVEKPLSAVLNDFRFILLENCGHKPWLERQARTEFYRVLLDVVGR